MGRDMIVLEFEICHRTRSPPPTWPPARALLQLWVWVMPLQQPPPPPLLRPWPLLCAPISTAAPGFTASWTASQLAQELPKAKGHVLPPRDTPTWVQANGSFLELPQLLRLTLTVTRASQTPARRLLQHRDRTWRWRDAPRSGGTPL